MSVVSDVVDLYLPSKTKMTPSGWRSFNAVCCIHNGHSADTRSRAGVKTTGDNFSYHCFNCGYVTGWQPGFLLGYKMKKLLEWLDVPDDVINKLQFEILKINQEIGEVEREQFVHVPKFEPKNLPDGSKLISDYSDPSVHLQRVIDYAKSRSLNLEDYPLYWSPTLSWRDRMIIPFFYKGITVGYTARSVKPDEKTRYISDYQPGYVFNIDSQDFNKAFAIVTEGPLDALPIDGVSLLGSSFNDSQVEQLNRLKKEIIVVPDRDKNGQALLEQALDLGYSVSLPEWEPDIKDTGDAVRRYGRVYALYSIRSAAETSNLKIRLREKQWFKNY